MNKGLLFLIFLGFVACQSPESSTARFLFAGHTYDWQAEAGNRLDPRLENMDLKPYNGIWLGGDVLARTTEQLSTLDYLQQIFPFSSQTVHWALGNHDVKYGYSSALEDLRTYPRYYAQWVEGVVILVLDTNFFQWPNARPEASFCAQMQAQDELVKMVTDTIQEASHLIVLHHYNLLTQSISGNQVDPDTIVNFHKPFLKMVCSPDTATFSNRWWPEFEEVQAQGVQVVFVSGDLGMQSKKMEVRTPEGIWFLGAALNNTVDPQHAPSYVKDFGVDQLLEFEYDQVARTMKWNFLPLE